MLLYGIVNVFLVILVGSLVLLVIGLLISCYVMCYGVDIDFLMRGVGFGYIGLIIILLIYVSFIFILFVIEVLIMLSVLEFVFGVLLWLGYIISVVVVILLVIYGIIWISWFQLVIQLFWIIFNILLFVFIVFIDWQVVGEWLIFFGIDLVIGVLCLEVFGWDSISLVSFGVVLVVIFVLMV